MERSVLRACRPSAPDCIIAFRAHHHECALGAPPEHVEQPPIVQHQIVIGHEHLNDVAGLQQRRQLCQNPGVGSDIR